MPISIYQHGWLPMDNEQINSSQPSLHKSVCEPFMIQISPSILI